MPKDRDQISLFDASEIEEDWKNKWQDMPEFCHEDLTSQEQIIVHFRNKEDRIAFSKLIEQTVTYRTQSIWFPKATIETYVDKRYTDES